MSVYTPLEHDALAQWLRAHYDYRLSSFTETTHGIENSNFFINGTDSNGTPSARVLTVFESVKAADLPYFSALLGHLGNHGIPVPAPCPERSGEAIGHINGKSCMLVPRLPGEHIQAPTITQCQAIGAMLARLHTAADDFSQRRHDPFGDDWRRTTLALIGPHLPHEDLALAQWLLDRWAVMEQDAQVSHGVIHADLFHDNALFTSHEVTGVIDFYYACDGVRMYDLAILVNDWCNDNTGVLDRRRHDAVVEGYQSVRRLHAAERNALPAWQVFAALRFWLSRWRRVVAPDGGRLKSTDAMRAILLDRLGRSPLVQV